MENEEDIIHKGVIVPPRIDLNRKQMSVLMWIVVLLIVGFTAYHFYKRVGREPRSL